MKEKKHIDRFFIEKLKDLDAVPSEAVWENIKEALDKKKKSRRVIPIWFRYAGVAALILLLFSVGSFFYPTTQDAVITNNDKLQDEQNNVDVVLPENTVFQNKSSLVVAETPVSNSEQNNVDKSNTEKSRSFSHSNIALQASVQKGEENIAVKEDVENTIIAFEDPIISSFENNSKVSSEAQALNEVKVEEDIKKQSLFDAIKENQEIEVLAKIEEEKTSKFDIRAIVAPIYYNTLGNGSSIDAQFVDNSKSSDINFSYGVQLSYDLNKRLSLRAGINKVDVSYNTNDVAFVPTSKAFGTSNIKFDSGRVYALGDKGTIPQILQAIAPQGQIPQTQRFMGPVEGDLSQELSYIELPVEISYSLLNKTFGINLIGGFSTLFLTNNELSISAQNFNAVLGEANNLSDVSFSTNIGLGLDYKISKSLKFNLEPIFKYHLNAYTNDAGGFKPYTLGVYSGFSFKF